MPKQFDGDNPPFDQLTAAELADLRASLDVEYFRAGDRLITRGQPTDHLHVIIKGAIEERDGEDVVSILGPKDSFDSRAIVQGIAGHDFIAREETLCYLLPREKTLDLIRRNTRFGGFFYLDLGQKLAAAERNKERRQVDTLMRARVGDIFLHPAVFLDAADTIEAAGHQMRTHDTNALFVRDGTRTGIVTGMNLSKAVVLKRLPLKTPVGQVCHWDLVTIAPRDHIATALIAMTKHNKRRLAVRDGEAFVGILEDIDLLGFIAGNAQVTVGRIERATAVEDLEAAAREIGLEVERLRRQGLRAHVIAELVSDLNRRLFAKTFDLIAPEAIRAQGCLIVMGSEGRGEQAVRTDQDNGLILAEPVEAPTLDAFRTAFTDTLTRFGFPPCPGNVMVRNPLWSRTLDDYQKDFFQWTALPSPETHMNIAIFADAVAVAGQEALLTEAKAALFAHLRGERVQLAHFARAIDAFDTPIGLFNQLLSREGERGDAIDMKKGGLFPVVHGARVLAIELGLTETSTARRIALIAGQGIYDSDFAQELIQAFHYLMDWQLDAKLAARGAQLVPARPGVFDQGLVRPSALTSMERDLLRESFSVVKQFREIVRRHFNLSVF